MDTCRIFGNKALVEKVDLSAEYLNQYVGLLDETEGVTQRLKELHSQCRNSFLSLIEEISSLRVRLQL